MNSGRTIFAQIMDYMPTYEFRQCVERYAGNYKVRSFSCRDQFLSMAFAQLTYRESLRDIQACLRAAKQKTYHMGIRGNISRNTLAHANQTRDWRIYADRPLLIAFSLGNIPQEQGSSETAYPSRFERQYPNDCFYYQRQGSRSQYPRQTSNRTRSRLHHGSRLSGLRTSLQTASVRGLLCNTSQEQRQIQSLLLPEDRQNNRTEIRSDCNFTRLLRQKRLSRKAQTDFLLRQDPKQETDFSDQQLQLAGPDHHGDLPKTLADRIVLQMDKAASADKSFLRHIRECGQNTDMDCHRRLCAGGDHQEAFETGAESLHNFTNYQRDTVRENTAFTSAYRCWNDRRKYNRLQPTEFI